MLPPVTPYKRFNPVKLIPIAIAISSLVAVAIGAWIIAPDFIAQASYKGLTSDLHISSNNNQDSSSSSGSEQEDSINWQAANEKIPAASAWLTVDGTSVDLPVAQASQDNPDFYLSHDIWGNYSQSGSLFLDEFCTPQGSSLIVYGHKMNYANSMFHDLGDKAAQDAFNALGEARWYVEGYKTAHFVPVAATRVNAYESDLRNVPHMNDKDRSDWVKNVFLPQATARSNYDVSTISPNTRILFLVTCSGYARYGQDARTVIMYVEKV